MSRDEEFAETFTLRNSMSPSLEKRMQGKSCFNFTTIEPAQLKELAA
jgi:hypothetical protein